MSETFLDLAIERVFADNGGILGFLKFCLSQWKVFKSESVKSFELLAKVIELHPTKVKKYATNAILVSSISILPIFLKSKCWTFQKNIFIYFVDLPELHTFDAGFSQRK